MSLGREEICTYIAASGLWNRDSRILFRKTGQRLCSSCFPANEPLRFVVSLDNQSEIVLSNEINSGGSLVCRRPLLASPLPVPFPHLAVSPHMAAFTAHDRRNRASTFQAAHQSCIAHRFASAGTCRRRRHQRQDGFHWLSNNCCDKGRSTGSLFVAKDPAASGCRRQLAGSRPKLDRLLHRSYQEPANGRLAKHLHHDRPYLFAFLYCPELEAPIIWPRG